MTPTRNEPVAPPRILVLRYSSLGDVALTNPILDGLQAANPRSEVYFATKKKYAPVIQNHPFLTKVIPLEGPGLFSFLGHLGEIKKVDPILVLDLHNSIRTHLLGTFLRKPKWIVYDKDDIGRWRLVGKAGAGQSPHTILKYMKVLEPLGVRPHLQVKYEVHVSKNDQAYMRDFMERRRISSSQMVVGIGPGALWKTKRWMPERYAELASRLVEWERCRIFWFGSRDEAPLIQSIQNKMRGSPLERGINLAREVNLEQAIALMGRCEVFIGNDSGLGHLASGRGCRVVVIYGSTTPSLGFEPWGPHSVVEVTGLPCRPCDPIGRKSCPLGHFKCMEDLTVDLVEGAVKRSVRRSR